jgi:hypothetical protein
MDSKNMNKKVYMNRYVHFFIHFIMVQYSKLIEKRGDEYDIKNRNTKHIWK